MTQQADDQTVRDADPLWRRIHPCQFVDDGQGGRKLSSAAFDNSSDGTGMSVSLGREAEAAGVATAMALQRFPGFGMASITAGTCRAHNQTIQRDPTKDDRHHALVNGDKPKRVQRALARAATVLVRPQDAP